MQRQEMRMEEIAPFVRHAGDVYVTRDWHKARVTAYDHRLFYVVSGQATVEVDGATHEVGPGSVMYWLSGTAYRIRPAEDQVLHLIAINFDYTPGHADTVQFLPMVQAADYDPERRMENVLLTDAPRLNAPIILSGMAEILPCLQSMMWEAAAPRGFGQYQLSNLMRVVLVQLCREASQHQPGRTAVHSAQVILEYIHGHFAEELDNKALARRFGYHPNYISQLIADETGAPLHQYILKLRIRQALYLLQTTDLTVSEIAHQVGYRSASYFSQYFRQCTGHSPRAFRVR